MTTKAPSRGSIIGPWPGLFKKEQLAAYLSLSTNTVGIRVNRRAFPQPIIVAAQERWRRPDIDAWIEAGCPNYEEWFAAGRPAEGLAHSMPT